MSTNQINGPEIIVATRSGREGAMEMASSAVAMPFARIEQDIDETALVPLPGSSLQQSFLKGYGYTYRANWGALHGQWILSLNSPRFPALTPRSRVFVTISEGAAGGPDAGKFIGAARYTVHNVAPRVNGVDVWVNIEWGTDILLYVDYLVINA
ncbi:hypothetical protein [Burkholderia sp. LMU1-1-1.1]|uniref:hypothetical protein n=1 Tax=Burkholderia sp. LMU1-1-1.1 TaxID=3135266 RepID=UPI0034468DCE